MGNTEALEQKVFSRMLPGLECTSYKEILDKVWCFLEVPETEKHSYSII